MNIYPLFEGVHAMKPTEDGGMDIYHHSGAVTLIQDEHHNILVDVGGRGSIETIRELLSEHGLTCDDIDTVILTHFHLDHAYNVAFFDKAKIFGWIHEWKDQQTIRFGDIESLSISGVRIIRTPGHAEESLAVLATDDNGIRYIMAGDAINETYFSTGNISGMSYDKDLYRASADKILSLADVIIPGHGKPLIVKDRPKNVSII